MRPGLPFPRSPISEPQRARQLSVNNRCRPAWARDPTHQEKRRPGRRSAARWCTPRSRRPRCHGRIRRRRRGSACLPARRGGRQDRAAVAGQRQGKLELHRAVLPPRRIFGGVGVLAFLPPIGLGNQPDRPTAWPRPLARRAEGCGGDPPQAGTRPGASTRARGPPAVAGDGRGRERGRVATRPRMRHRRRLGRPSQAFPPAGSAGSSGGAETLVSVQAATEPTATRQRCRTSVRRCGGLVPGTPVPAAAW